jgi:hypothetical protein
MKWNFVAPYNAVELQYFLVVQCFQMLGQAYSSGHLQAPFADRAGRGGLRAQGLKPAQKSRILLAVFINSNSQAGFVVSSRDNPRDLARRMADANARRPAGPAVEAMVRTCS